MGFRGWVSGDGFFRVRVLGYGFGVRGRKVKLRDCALASDLVRAVIIKIAKSISISISILISNLPGVASRSARGAAASRGAAARGAAAAGQAWVPRLCCKREPRSPVRQMWV